MLNFAYGNPRSGLPFRRPWQVSDGGSELGPQSVRRELGTRVPDRSGWPVAPRARLMKARKAIARPALARVCLTGT